MRAETSNSSLRPRQRSQHRAERRRVRGAVVAANVSACAVLSVALPLIALPWFFGGTVFEARLVLMLGCIVSLVFWVVLQIAEIEKSPPLAWSWLAACLLAGLVLVQCQRLPAGFVGSLSPTAARLWSQVLTENSQTQGWKLDIGSPSPPPNPSPSIYPAATRYELAQILVAMAVFFVASCYLHEARWLVVVSVAIVVNGTCLAFVGLAQQMRSTGSIYEREARQLGAQFFSSFTNRNNAAGYLNMCIAVAIGVLLWALVRSRSQDVPFISSLAPASHARWDRFVALFKTWMIRLGLRIASLDGFRLFAVCTVILLVAGLMSSLSRGGMFSCLIAAVATLFVFQKARDDTVRVPWLSVSIAAVIALVLVLWLGRGSAINDRLAPLVSGAVTQDARLEHWVDALRTATAFWRMGSGLGTYRHAYTLYESRPSELWWHHADNQYLELLVEGGLPGLGLALVLLFLLACAVSRLLREPSDSVPFISGIAGTYALVSQAVHSMFDFGLVIPANSALFAAIWGALVGQAIRLGKERQPGTGLWFRLQDFVSISLFNGRAVSAVTAACLVLAVSWAANEIRAASAVRESVRAVSPEVLSPEVDSDAIGTYIGRLDRAVSNRPDDAEGQLSLAELWLTRYRQQALRKLAAQESDRSAAELWEFTSPAHLHGFAHRLLKANRISEWDTLRAGVEVQSNVLAAARCLTAASLNSAALGRPLLMLSQIGPLVSESAPEDLWLENFRPRANADPQLLLECGLLEIQRGEIETGLEDWRNVLRLSPSSFVPLLRYSQQNLELAEQVRILLPNDPELLLRAARDELPGEQYRSLRETLISRVKVMIADGLVPAQSRAYIQAVLASMASDWKTAIVQYLNALEQRPQMVSWRYELALALQQDGQYGRAREQAEVCAQLEPENPIYDKLRRELIRLEVRGKEN